MGKRVIVEKDGQQGLVDAVQIKGLEKHGWTVVDDGNSGSEQVVVKDQSPSDEE